MLWQKCKLFFGVLEKCGVLCGSKSELAFFGVCGFGCAHFLFLGGKNMSEKYPGSVYRLTGTTSRVIVYEDRVDIERTGFLNKLSYGFSGTKSIPMSSITSIQYKAGGSILNGFLQFGVLGGKERNGGLTGAQSDENSVIFSKDKNEKAEKIKAFVEKKIAERSSPAQSAGTVSTADEILKLKQLLDAGVITVDEFETKKKQLLGV